METIVNLPPHDIEAEEATLGCIILEGELIRDAIAILKAEDFYAERNQQVYKACRDIYSRRGKINKLTVAHELNARGLLESVGGAAYLEHLTGAMVTTLDFPMYAELVQKDAMQRKIVELGEKITKLGYANLPELDQTLTELDVLTRLTKTEVHTADKQLVTPDIAAMDILELQNKYATGQDYPAWGFSELDRITAGIAPEFYLIGARPSVGKTQLMLDIADNLVSQGRRVLFVSAEMTWEQIMERKVARELGISVLEMRKDGIPAHRHPELVALSGRTSKTKIDYLCENVWVSDIQRRVERMKLDGGVDAVFVDYLSILRDCWVSGARETRNILVGRVSKQFKQMAKDYKVPFLVASQLNREPEHRATGTSAPGLSDLRDSGELEQDADVVLLLHRAEDEQGNKLNFIFCGMEKNRQLGWHAPIRLYWNSKYHRYVDSEDWVDEAVVEQQGALV